MSIPLSAFPLFFTPIHVFKVMLLFYTLAPFHFHVCDTVQLFLSHLQIHAHPSQTCLSNVHLNCSSLESNYHHSKHLIASTMSLYSVHPCVIRVSYCRSALINRLLFVYFTYFTAPSLPHSLSPIISLFLPNHSHPLTLPLSLPPILPSSPSLHLMHC